MDRCIYKALRCDDGRCELVCVATKRAINCDLNEARRWKEGTGIAGVSFSVRDEVIIPDLQSEGISTVFGSASNETRHYDNERYRSMVAVPIMVGKSEEPWGVVAATNDRVAHFSVAQENGLANHEGARALANMAALAISLCRTDMNHSSNGGFPTTA